MVETLFIWGISIVAATAFLVGVICLLASDNVYEWKSCMGHYREGHKERIEIRSFGMQLVTVSVAMAALLYSTWNYQLARKEFNVKNRPFLGVVPKPLEDGKFYQTTQTHGGPQIQFKFIFANKGNLPAYDIKISRKLRIGHVEIGAIPGNHENQKEIVVIFPGDSLSVTSPFTIDNKDMTLVNLENLIRSNRIVLEYRIDYTGIEKRKQNPYYTIYRFKYPTEWSQELIGIEADQISGQV